MNIADLFVKIRADLSGLQQEVVRGAQQAGDKAGQSAGQRFSAGLKTAGKVGVAVLGASLAAGFGLGVRGVVELDGAMARFQSETGATKEEVDRASDSVLDFSKRNLQGVNEIADTMAALRTQMGLTQEGAEALTEPFLKFAEVTGQDGPTAVSAFDDILDSWNLTAEDAKGLMDQLIVSHQKWGGNIADNQRTLAGLAPAMQAANFEIDDGIALLNLFGAKGLDANTAAAAFSKALTKVESPEELKTLIEDISNTEDPFERAQKAAALFGAKAGAKLANALQPGAGSLEDYAVSADDAAGATEKASDALESSWGNRAKLFIKNISGMATGLVKDLGPGIGGVAAAAPLAAGALRPLFSLMKQGASQFIPLLTGSIGKIGPALGKLGPLLLKGLMGLAPVVAGAGSAIGTAFSAAASAVIAAWPLVLIGLIIAAIAVLIASPEIREKVFKFIGGIFKWIGDALGKLGEFLGKIFGAAFDVVAKVIGKAVEVMTWPLRTFLGIVKGVAEWILKTGAGLFKGAFEAVSKVIGAVVGAIGAVIGGIVDFIKGVIRWIFGDGKTKTEGAFNAVKGVIDGVVKVIGAIIGGIVTAISTVIGWIKDVAGGLFGTAFNVVKGVIEGVVGVINGIINGITGVVSGVAKTIGDFFDWLFGNVDKGKSELEALRNSGVLDTQNAALGINFGGRRGPTTSPAPAPTTTSPTSYTGANTRPPPMLQTGAWSLPANMLAYLHAGEMVVPPAAAEALRRFFGHGGGVPGQGGSSGDTINIAVNLLDKMEVRNVRDIGGALRALGEQGHLSPRRRRMTSA